MNLPLPQIPPPLTAFALLGVVATFVMYISTGLRQRRHVLSITDFLIYGKGMSGPELRYTFIATNISLASIFLGLAYAGYKDGAAAFWLPIAWLAGIATFWLFYRRISTFFKQGNTLHEFLGTAFESDLIRQLAATLTLFGFVGSVGIEFYAVAKVLKLIGIPVHSSFLLATIFAVLSLSYTSMSGFRGVVKTSVQQVYLIGLGVIACVLLAFGQTQALGNQFTASVLQDSARGFWSNTPLAIGAFVLFLPFIITSMDMWQRCAAVGRNCDANRQVRNSLLWGSFAFVITYSVPIVLGLISFQLNSAGHLSDAEALMFPVLTLPGTMSAAVHTALVVAVLIGLTAAAFSTADTLLVTSVYSLFYDIYAVRKKVDLNHISTEFQPGLIRLGRLAVAALGLAAVATSLFGWSLDKLIFAFFSSQIVLIIPVLCATFFPRFAARHVVSGVGCISMGFVTPLAVAAADYFSGKEDLTPLAPVIALGIAAIVFVGLLPFRRRKVPMVFGVEESGDEKPPL